MKVFLDTNVLVSALSTHGLCSDVLREILSDHQLIISSFLIVELKRVLTEKIQLPKELINESISFLRYIGEISDPLNRPNIDITDQDDIPLIHSALYGEADLFVTGDKELLSLKVVNKMMVVSPRAFWELLRSQQ